MRKNEKFPFAMTRKALVVYIVFTVLLGLFLFFVIGDMAGKCAACIVCPMLIAYLLYAYCKESKADTKAREMKAQYMNIKKPFKLEGITRIDDTPVHKVVRESWKYPNRQETDAPWWHLRS